MTSRSAQADTAAREQLTRRLLKAGANPARDRKDLTALFERAADAVVFGDLESLHKLLEEEPALVYARSPRPHRATHLHGRFEGSSTALHAAGGHGHREAVRLLLDRSADVALRNVWGATPADTARYFGHPEIAELIEQCRPSRVNT